MGSGGGAAGAGDGGGAKKIEELLLPIKELLFAVEHPLLALAKFVQ